MLRPQAASISDAARPVVIGTGLTGLAISHALSASGIAHFLIGRRPSLSPRLGESLNAEGSLEIARQFPDYASFFHAKRRVALFFDGHAAAFDSLHFAAGRAMFAPFGYPTDVELLHVDRIGFDRALFDAVVADDRCLYIGEDAVEVAYDTAADRIDGVGLATGKTVASTYAFDATNHKRFIATRVGVPYRRIDAPRRVVFAHYTSDAAMPEAAPTWLSTTSLTRLEPRTDPVDGIAWCIPLGAYVSVGISVDPAATGANPELLLDWVEQAYALRGLDFRRSFARRSTPVDAGYEHYTHERCYGRNWLLAGPSCCQIWFPAAAGVATSLIAARLAPDLIRTPQQTAPLYQEYIDRVAAGHDGLAWMSAPEPWAMPEAALQQRAQAMVNANVRRLAAYFRLTGAAGEPGGTYGPSALTRMYESDRLLANPLHIDTAMPSAQATRLFAATPPDPWTSPPLNVPVLTRPDRLDGPAGILAVIDLLSGRQSPDAAARWLADTVELQIDRFGLQGIAPWNSWVGLLRASPRIGNLQLVAASVGNSGDGVWTMTGQWQGVVSGRQIVSPQFSIAFTLANDKITQIRTQRADYTFVLGDAILPNTAFAALIGRLAATAAKPA